MESSRDRKQLEDMVRALIDACHDKQEDVRRSIANSLHGLGTKQPKIVLSSCHLYLQKHSKLPTNHRITILHIMERICKDGLEEIPDVLVREIIQTAGEEMLSSKEVLPEWQSAASNLLVALGSKYCTEVMDQLFNRFQPGVLPHFFIMQTMGNLAVANPSGTVHYLKGILGTLIPLLGSVKHDNMKWAFSFSIGKFSECILEYIANTDKTSEPGIRKEGYATEIMMAYDVMATSWLQHKDAKIRLMTIEALGPMSHLVTRDKMEEQITRLLPIISTLYKKHPPHEHYSITQGLCMVLDAAVKDNCQSLELQVDFVLNLLFNLVCITPDYVQPMTVKNQNELLRCFEVLAHSYTDKLVPFLLVKIENNNEKVRIGSLLVLKHLVNAADAQLCNKMATIVQDLKAVLADPSNKVKKLVAQLVVALAHRDYLKLEGGTALLEFIILQCALPNDSPGKRLPDVEYVSNESLRSMCENILHILTTTMDNMENVLWPFLLECIIPQDYTNAVGIVCKAAAYIANKKREAQSDDFHINYANHDDFFPKPVSIISRMFVLLGHPHSGKNRGIQILKLMRVAAPILHKDLVALLDAKIPKLIQILEDHANSDESWNQQEWEERVLLLVGASLDEIDRQEWVSNLGATLANHFILYDKYANDKNFLTLCIGITLKKSTNIAFVNQHMDIIINNTNHAIVVEREGCARALGLCAAAHLDAVLQKLAVMSKTDPSRKSTTGLLSYFMDNKTGSTEDKMVCSMILAYGQVAFHASPALITAKIDSILKVVMPFFSHLKDPAVKLSLVQCVELIGRALLPDPNHLGDGVCLPSRNQIIQHLTSILQAEGFTGINSNIQSLTLDACTSLIKLNAPLSSVEVTSLLEVCTACVYPLQPNPPSTDNVPEYKAFIAQTMASLNRLMRVLVSRCPDPDGLFTVFKCLEVWIKSREEYKRTRALASVESLLRWYRDNLQLGIGKPLDFYHCGHILGMLIPRCTDPVASLRVEALSNVQLVISILNLYAGHENGENSTGSVIGRLQSEVYSDDATVLFATAKTLAKTICEVLPVCEFQSFMATLLDGVSDYQEQSAAGCTVVYNAVVKAKGGMMYSEIQPILKSLHERLQTTTSAVVRRGVLQVLRSLANHHLTAVLNTLLEFPLPPDSHMVDFWKSLAQDSQLNGNVVEQLRELLSRNSLYDEHPDPRNRQEVVHVANQQSLACVCALREMFRSVEINACVTKDFTRLFSILLLVCGTYVDVYPPAVQAEGNREGKPKPLILIVETKSARVSPVRTAIECVQALLLCAKCDHLLTAAMAENCWTRLDKKDRFPDAIAVLTSELAQHYPQYIPGIIAALNPSLTSQHDAQRVVVTTVFGQLINDRCGGDAMLLEIIISSLLGRLVDTSHVVRRLSIRGLSNIESCAHPQVDKYATTALSAMLAGMDDKDDLNGDITLEAMSGLSRILNVLGEKDVRTVVINVALRIRPCFEKDNPEIRAAAFRLFGDLAKFGGGQSEAAFCEQIHNNFVSLLLHLNDMDETVIKACKHALRLLGGQMGSVTINDMFVKHMRVEGNLRYPEFINDLSKAIITDFPDKYGLYVAACSNHFKSIWPIIQCNAATLIGSLLGNLPVEKQGLINKDNVCQGLILLLKDPNKDVRILASEAMGLLYAF